MVGGASKRLADAFEGIFHGRLALNVKAKIAGDRIDFRWIERDTAAVDCSNKLPGTGVI
ncbi:MAG: hypothetical protein WAR41_04550 [Azonexus sp.]|jgi:hypothetical protein